MICIYSTTSMIMAGHFRQVTMEGAVFSQMVNMLHHRNISRTPWLGYYVAWRTLVIVARYKKTP